MTHTQLLLNSGYQKQDLLDLCDIFEDQIQHFQAIYQSLDVINLANQIHKLVGGCKLLQFIDVAEQLSILEKNLKQKQQLTEKELDITRIKISELMGVLVSTTVLFKTEINSL